MTITFNDTNPEGGYVAGDVIDVFYDIDYDTSIISFSSNGIFAQLNGVDITSGSYINYQTKTYKTVKIYGNQICNQGYDVQFSTLKSSFPWVYNLYFENHILCSITPIVCDLSFSPKITLVYPTGTSTNDGSVTVEAISSNSIKYKLGSDFDYNDGTGQSSGIFNSLYHGSFRIYARDSHNCGANILVNLPVNEVYGVIYRITYINLANHSTKIEILKRNYIGSVSDMIISDGSINLSMRNEGNLDKFQPIISTQATLDLISETDKQFQELFTNEPQKYQIAFYKDISGGTSYVLQWIGFIIPQIYQEEYLQPPYKASVQASDCLSILSDLLFLQDDGNRFFGSIKIIDLISIILNRTNLHLPIRCAANIYADTMSQGATDDPFDQAYVDVEAYYLATDSPTYEFVLTCILKAFRARLIQAEGRWNILRPEELTSSYNYRDFDSTGIYVSNGSINPIINVAAASDSNRVRWSDQDQNLEIRPGFGKFRVKYNLGYKDNILRNGDFGLITQWDVLQGKYTYQLNLFGFQIVSPTYAITKSYELITPGDLNNVALVLSASPSATLKPFGYIQSDNYLMAMGVNNSINIKLNIKCPSGIAYGIATDGDGNIIAVPYKTYPYYQKVRMTVYWGGKYLQNDGSWTSIPTNVIFYVTQFDQYIDLEIPAKWPDSSYFTEKSFNVKVYHSAEIDYDYDSQAALKRAITNSSVATYNNRGNYDASSGVFPSIGGSGGGGSIQAGDLWTINVAGAIYGVSCAVGVRIRCINSSPGQDPLNWLIGEIQLPEGTKTELLVISSMYYYQLNNTTDAESYPEIIRPNDYNSGTNPMQWKLVHIGPAFDYLRESVDFYINKIQVQYLDNGQSPFDTLIRDITGESNNTLFVEDEIYHGSLNSIVVTENVPALLRDRDVNSSLNFLLQYSNQVTYAIEQNILSGKLIYAGYLRDSSGVGYDTWARPGISELDQFHAIWLKTSIAQYNRSWKKITGSFYSNDTFFFFLNVLLDTLEDNIIYMPASLSYDDKNNTVNGEFLELMDIYSDSGSDGTSTSPISSGFSSGFGS